MFTFAQDGFVELGSEGFREFVDLIVAVNLDGLLGGVQHYVAFTAPMQMLFQLFADSHADGAIQVIGQLFQKLSALHGWPSPPLLDLKYFARRSRSCKRARNSRDRS